MKKLFSISILIIIICSSLGATVVYAQEAGTLLPETTKSDDQCDKLLDDLNNKFASLKKVPKPDGATGSASEPREYFAAQDRTYRNDVLACAVITGKISFWMVPFYIVYLIEFAIGISGLIAIAFLVIGGFQYVIGGVTEKQETAKNTIKFALTGLVIVLTAWVVVNLVQFLITI